MAIQYALYRNGFSKEQKEYVARIIPRGCYHHKDLVELMQFLNPGLSEAMISHVLEAYTSAIEFVLKEGKSVSTPLLKVQISIHGKFTDTTDRFQSGRHTVRLNTSPGTDLKKIISKLKLKKVTPTITPSE